MIKVTILRTDCRVLESDCATWKTAAERIVKMSDDDFYAPNKWFKIFATNPDRSSNPEELFLHTLKENLVAGSVPNHD